MSFVRAILACLAFGPALAACSGSQQAASKTAADVKNAVSPIVGSWQINGGSAPAPQPNLPQFVRLDFTTGGTLEASYVAAGGALASIVKTPTKLKSEHDAYALHGNDHLSIVEGSRALDYTFAVRDGKLFLTPSGASQAIVYQKAS